MIKKQEIQLKITNTNSINTGFLWPKRVISLYLDYLCSVAFNTAAYAGLTQLECIPGKTVSNLNHWRIEPNSPEQMSQKMGFEALTFTTLWVATPLTVFFAFGKNNWGLQSIPLVTRCNTDRLDFKVGNTLSVPIRWVGIWRAFDF